jgi:hypothetical protein
MAQYFDVLGILPWWVKYCLLKSDRLEPSMVRVHDQFVVPVSRFIESFVTPPAGKNIILVAQKSRA